MAPALSTQKLIFASKQNHLSSHMVYKGVSSANLHLCAHLYNYAFTVPSDLEAQESLLVSGDSISRQKSLKQHPISDSHPSALTQRPFFFFKQTNMCFFSACCVINVVVGVDLKCVHRLSKYMLEEPFFFIKTVTKLCRVQTSYWRWGQF